MPVRGIHVIIDKEDHPTRAAVGLAVRFGAHLSALAVEEQPELTHYMEEARAIIRTRVAGDRARFVALAAAANVEYSVHEIAVPTNGSVEDILRHCRLSDLIVIGKSGAQEPFHSGLIRRLLLDSAAPVLVVPPQTGDPVFDRALVAWDGRSVAAHAIHSAVPVLRLAKTVTIASVVPRGSTGPDSSDLAAYLKLHGISVTHRCIFASGSVADTLLGHISEEQIDWITIGAFSRSRFDEILFGSPTREMLAETTVPMLMHH